MKYKFNPLTGEFNLVPDSGTLKQKLNWLTGNFNLTKDAGKYKQIYNVIEGEFNLYPATTQVVIHGTGSIQLTNAVENGLLSLTAYGGTEQRVKNLFDKDDSTMLFDGFINNAAVGETSKLISYGGGDKTIRIKVNPNTTYTVIRATNLGNVYDRIRCASFTELPVNGSQGVILCNYMSYTQDSATFTTLSDTEYVAINVRNSGTVGDDWTQYIDAFLVYQGTSQTPTPTAPMDIISNNGILKFSKNMANVNTQTALVGYYISTSGQVLESPYNRIYQEFIPCKPSTKYTLSISSAVYYVTISEYVSASDSGFYRRNAGSTGGNTKLTITTGANTTYLRFGANLSSSNITIDDVLAINWQLEQGDTPTPYHEYVEGGVYVDGTVETISNRINLFDINKVTDGYYYTTQGQYEAAEAARLTDFIPVQAGETYVFKYTAVGGPNVRLNYFDTNKTWLSQTITSSVSGTYSYNITPAQDGYVRISANRANAGSQSYIDWDNTVIETYGDTATAQMLLKIGDYADEQEILSGNIIRKVGVKVLDGTENWQKGSVQIANYSFWVDDGSFAILTNRTILCTHFQSSQTLPPATQADRNNKIWRGTSDVAGTQASICIGYNFDGTVAQFKQWLADQYAAGTPVILVYPLATPKTESVAGQTMNIPAGNSTIEITQASIDNLELEATYEQEA